MYVNQMLHNTALDLRNAKSYPQIPSNGHTQESLSKQTDRLTKFALCPRLSIRISARMYLPIVNCLHELLTDCAGVFSADSPVLGEWSCRDICQTGYHIPIIKTITEKENTRCLFVCMWYYTNYSKFNSERYIKYEGKHMDRACFHC